MVQHYARHVLKTDHNIFSLITSFKQIEPVNIFMSSPNNSWKIQNNLFYLQKYQQA